MDTATLIAFATASNYNSDTSHPPKTETDNV